MREFCGSLLLLLTSAALGSAEPAGSRLNPDDFDSLGALELTSGTITFNTDTLTVTGFPDGELADSESGQSEIAVFCFDRVELSGLVVVSIVGSRPIALLSKTDITLDVSLDLSGSDGSDGGLGGPGGYDGTTNHGEGPGGGQGWVDCQFGDYIGGAGAGFGGKGGKGTGGYAGCPYGGPSYGTPELTELQGGSGGGGGETGGGGGGALELSAKGIITLDSHSGLIVRGGEGEFGSTGKAGGGGSGGALLLNAWTITSAGVLDVAGGDGGDVEYFLDSEGGGGGGGRIAIYSNELELGGFSFEGGAAGVDEDGASFADAGQAGTLYWAPFALDCNGNGVSDDEDIAASSSEDCNQNGIPDECDIEPIFKAASLALSPIDGETPQSWIVNPAPQARGDVYLTFFAVADLGSIDEWINVDINGAPVGSVFTSAGADCPVDPDFDTLYIDDATYNALNFEEIVSITMTPTGEVGNTLCYPSYIAATIEYAKRTGADCNVNGVPDDCDISAGTSSDCNLNGAIDQCDIDQGDSGDSNGNGIPDECEGRIHNLTSNLYYDTIQSAIDDAAIGDEIEVSSGLFQEQIDFLGKSIVLRSLDPFDSSIVEATRIDGSASGTVVTMSAGTISGFTIQNGSSVGAKAGGIEATGTAMASHNVITANTAEERGGGVSAAESVVVYNNHIISNTAGTQAGGVNASGSAVIIDNVISGNHAATGGGGLWARENVLVRNNTFTSNSSDDSGEGRIGGGGVLAEGSAVILNNVVAFSADGAGIFVTTGTAVLADYNCVFGNVDGDYGGDAVPGAHDVNSDPVLQADNVHLNVGSPCIDAGDPATVLLATEFDIDNGVRIFNSRIEIGADETFSVPNCDGDSNGDGAVDPLDVGYVLARLGCLVSSGEPTCEAADVNSDGIVDPLDAGYVLARLGTCN